MNFLKNYKASILIVDDNPKNIQIVIKTLEKYNYSLSYALSGEKALSILDNSSFDLILLDIMMPNMSGYEVCKKIKENQKSKDTPVIFLSAKSTNDDIIRGLELGGIDYITKPFNHLELRMRVTNHLELILSRKYWQYISYRDGLTELYNHKYMIDRLIKEMDIASLKSRPLSIIIFDIDFFKRVNDIYGHDYGDEVLKQVSKTVLKNLTTKDVACRYGGEEFCIILPNRALIEAVNLANEIKQDIFDLKWIYSEMKLTISAGVTQYRRGENINDFIKSADKLLYMAKHQGRDLVLP
jgi:diguanylate cyclase (GGDEF)-like protein